MKSFICLSRYFCTIYFDFNMNFLGFLNMHNQIKVLKKEKFECHVCSVVLLIFLNHVQIRKCAF